MSRQVKSSLIIALLISLNLLLHMADMLSAGIVKQHRQKFKG